MVNKLCRSLLCVALLAGVNGCDTTRDSGELIGPGMAGTLVIDSYLIVDEPLPRLLVSQTIAADQPYTNAAAAVSGAEVEIVVDGINHFYSSDPDSAGLYLPPAGAPLVLPNTTYHLRVESEGRIATAETTTPEPYTIQSAWLLDEQTLQEVHEMVIFANGTGMDEVFSAPENRLEYLRGLPELRFDPVAVPAYQVGVLRLDLDSEAVIDLSFLDDQDRRDVLEETKYGGASPAMELNEGRLRMPWFAIVFAGRHLFKVFALDENWFDYIRSNGVDTDNNWGGLAGDAFERPIFHIEGGIGLFGSASVDSIGLVVLPPAA